MSLIFCPNCNRKLIHQDNDIDVEHNCSSGKVVIDEEDVIDLSGDNPLMKGLATKNYGKSSWVNGIRIRDKTPRGASVQKTRTRAHTEFIVR